MSEVSVEIVGWGSVVLLSMAVAWRLTWGRWLGRFTAVSVVSELVALAGLLAYGGLIGSPLVSFAALALFAGALARFSEVLGRSGRSLPLRHGDARVVRLRVLSSVLDDGERRRIR